MSVLILTIFLQTVTPMPISKDEVWGFYGHRLINRMAVFMLPQEMIVFYKAHLKAIEENAVGPDRRRYVDPLEAPRHYIDFEMYGDSAWITLPRTWTEAVARYGDEVLQEGGMVPWHVNFTYLRLVDAFKERNTRDVIRLSTDLGHYIADAHVPLHTTENYNGQMTGQHGIHGLWESRIPELFAESYDFFIGKATYEPDPVGRIWAVLGESHLAVDSVLTMERELTEEMAPSRKYSFEQRGRSTVKVYSYAFSREYQRRLHGMVERRMRSSIQMLADFWFTAWVNAGQPDLRAFPSIEYDEVAEERSSRSGLRNHESGVPKND